MLTPQEITDKVFDKAVFGGYEMTGVDDFLEAVNADYTALYKENAILKGKLKVLVEKVEEYRSTEDSMRMALLTAQKMGEEITKEAEKQKEETLRSADNEIRLRLEETAKRIADEELRLLVAAKETGKFIELSQAIMRKHSEFLTKLETARRAVIPEVSSASNETKAVVEVSREDQIADAAEIIGNTMDKIIEQTPSPIEIDRQIDVDGQDETDDFIDDTIIYNDESEEDYSITPRPKFDFEDLKFGSNFDAEE